MSDDADSIISQSQTYEGRQTISSPIFDLSELEDSVATPEDYCTPLSENVLPVYPGKMSLLTFIPAFQSNAVEFDDVCYLTLPAIFRNHPHACVADCVDASGVNEQLPGSGAPDAALHYLERYHRAFSFSDLRCLYNGHYALYNAFTVIVKAREPPSWCTTESSRIDHYTRCGTILSSHCGGYFTVINQEFSEHARGDYYHVLRLGTQLLISGQSIKAWLDECNLPGSWVYPGLMSV